MRNLLRALRIIALALVTAACGAAHVLIEPPLRWMGRRRAAARTSALVFRVWSRLSLRILGARVEVRGPLPVQPFLLVTNHLGYVDILVLSSVLDCVFVSKAEVADWPVIGALVRMVGTVFIDRDAKRDIPQVLARIEEKIGHERGIVIFPEGTSSEGATVLPFRSPLLEVAARSRMPVSFAALSYRTPPGDPPARLAVCWWGDMTFGTHILELLRLRGFEATVTFGADRIREVDRKDLASRARQAVLEEFEPVTSTTL